MKNPKPYLIEFAQSLLDFTPRTTCPECNAYLYILLAVYTGIPIYVLTRPSTIINRSIWINVTKPNNQSFSLDLEIPHEFFQLCSSKNIDALTSLKKKADRKEITNALNVLASKNQQKIVPDELQVIFRLMCSKSKGMQREMKSRLDMISPDGSADLFYNMKVRETYLKQVSLIRLVEHRL